MERLQYMSGTVFKTINPYDELFRQQILQDREFTIMGLNNKYLLFLCFTHCYLLPSPTNTAACLFF